MSNQTYLRTRYYIAVFGSRNHASRLFYNLEPKDHYRFKLIPTPCRISAGCGYSVRFTNLNELAYLEEKAKEYDTPIKDIYYINNSNNNKTIRKAKASY